MGDRNINLGWKMAAGKIYTELNFLANHKEDTHRERLTRETLTRRFKCTEC